MAHETVYDVLVVGGGLAGSALAAVLAGAGLGVAVLEKEARFRDRVRGEGTWPYGVADAHRMGLAEPLARGGCVEIRALQRFENRVPQSTFVLADDAVDGKSAVAFFHPVLQEALFAWAAEQGATVVRPAKATGFALRDGYASVAVAQDGGDTEYRARLVVGADGKHSGVRRWTGGESESDPEHHRFGGVLVRGTAIDRECDNYCPAGEVSVNWFPAGPDFTRLYLIMPGERVKAEGVDRSFERYLAFCARYMPEGALDGAEQAGPIAFFPNSDTWGSRLAGERVTLVGDAAGSPDPTVGHGTSLLFRDARTLSDLLLSERDWDAAIGQYAARREAYFAPVRAVDRWSNRLREVGPEADRLREGNTRAKEADPTLGGFELMTLRGPDGLLPDEAARRHYFGEDLA